MVFDIDLILVCVNEFFIQQDVPNSMEELALTMCKHIINVLSLHKSAYEAFNQYW
jgi:hypothetical protein